MKLKIDNRSPVYIQVIRYFKEQIASGQLETGEEIPSRRELAATLNINPNTVQRAYKEMEEAGLIFTDGNMPSKVTRDEQVIKNVREELVTDALNHFVTTLRTLQIPLTDILPLLEKNYYDDRNKTQNEHTDKNDLQKSNNDKTTDPAIATKKMNNNQNMNDKNDSQRANSIKIMENKNDESTGGE